MVNVPDFPAWKCDICGYQEYDIKAIDNLALLLGTPEDISSHTPTPLKPHFGLIKRRLPSSHPKLKFFSA
jgi:hypothetical protein